AELHTCVVEGALGKQAPEHARLCRGNGHQGSGHADKFMVAEFTEISTDRTRRVELCFPRSGDRPRCRDTKLTEMTEAGRLSGSSRVGLTAASLGVIYGYDLSIIAGAQLFITEDFGLTTRQQELLTTMVVIGQIAGALGGGVLANAIGRKKSMVLIAAGYAVFALLGALSFSLPMLLAARFVL